MRKDFCNKLLFFLRLCRFVCYKSVHHILSKCEKMTFTTKTIAMIATK